MFPAHGAAAAASYSSALSASVDGNFPKIIMTPSKLEDPDDWSSWLFNLKALVSIVPLFPALLEGAAPPSKAALRRNMKGFLDAAERDFHLGRRAVGAFIPKSFSPTNVGYGKPVFSGGVPSGNFDMLAMQYEYKRSRGGSATKAATAGTAKADDVPGDQLQSIKPKQPQATPAAEPAQSAPLDDPEFDEYVAGELQRHLNMEVDAVHELRLAEYQLANRTLFVVITRNIRPADQVYIREHNGDGRAAFNALQEQHGGAGTSQATLMASMASFYNVTMETDDDVATMADRVHTTIGRISDHNKVRNKTAAQLLKFLEHAKVFELLSNDPRYMNIATALRTSDMQLSDMLRKVGEFERAQKHRDAPSRTGGGFTSSALAAADSKPPESKKPELCHNWVRGTCR